MQQIAKFTPDASQRLLAMSQSASFWDRMAARYPAASASAAPANAMGSTVRVLLERMGLLAADTDDNAPVHVLDVACGTGLVGAVLASAHDLREARDGFRVTATDFAPAMVEKARAGMQEAAWDGVTCEVMDAQSLTYPDGTFSHITCVFGIFIFPEPARFLQHARRTLIPGGTLGIAVQQSIWWHPVVPATVKRIRPDDPIALRPFRQWDHPWESADFIRSFLAEHGFVDVSVEAAESKARLQNMGAMVQGVLTPVREEVTRGWSEEELARWPGAVEEAAREVLPVEEDGSVTIPSATWIVTARAPRE